MRCPYAPHSFSGIAFRVLHTATPLIFWWLESATGRRQVDPLAASKGSTVGSRADPAGQEFSPRSPKATEARQRRGAELEAMIETRGASRLTHALGLVPSPVARHLQRVRRSSAMQTQRTVDGAPTPPSPESPHVRSPAVPAALGASSDRASRQRPSRHGASAQGRRRGAHRRIPQGPPAEHHRRHRQGIERRPRHDRRRAVAHRQGQRDQGGRALGVAVGLTLSRGVPQRASRPQREEAPDP